MKIKTKALGTVEIEQDQIITLSEGFYGFEDYHRFALLDAEQKPFIWIQSLDDAQLAFIAIDPFIFRPDYELDIDDGLLTPLGIDSPSDVLVFALVTVPADGSAITANLQGPLIINKKNKQALQLVIGGEKWKTKHDIVAEMKNGGMSC
ncbi:MAG: flagellar assembly protein FliW [Treponema phagedenis]|uniref:flagellar assembly protein FliW n=1 Tax=Treponema phagedenis TaxID=162 RepID=UPI0031341249